MSFSLTVGGLPLSFPLIISSGVWPMDVDFWKPPYTDGVGAICTKGITLNPRGGNRGVRVWETHSGLLNSIGLENPGIDGFLKDYLPMLKGRSVPLILNLWVEGLEDLKVMMDKLKPHRDEIDAIELNLSCPNVGKESHILRRRVDELKALVGSLRELWDRPLWVKLSPMSPSLIDEALAVEEEGADGVVIANTWLGMAIDVERERPVFERITAGLSGPAIFPLTLRLVWEVSSSVRIAVIGSGGVSSWEDAVAMILAGAWAVEIGSVTFWDLKAPLKIVKGMEDYLRRKGIAHYKDLVGRAKGGANP